MMKLVILCFVIAAVAARAPVYFAPGAFPTSAFGYPVPLQQPFNNYLSNNNYRGPLSLAPGQPANIVAADGRPLDTLDVNMDRSAHFVARAIDNGSRVLKKRSVTHLAVAPGPVGFSAAVAASNVGVAAPVAATPIATNPIGLATPFAGSFGITNPLVAGSLGLSTQLAAGPFGISAPVAVGPLAVSAPLTAGSLATGSIAVSTPVAAGSIGFGGVVGASLGRTF